MANQLLKSCQKTFSDLLTTLTKKNADYAGESQGPYKNFLDPELQVFFEDQGVGVDAVELGIRIRLRDKWARMNTLLMSGMDPQVKDERFEDTLCDMIGYLAIWKAYREWRIEHA